MRCSARLIGLVVVVLVAAATSVHACASANGLVGAFFFREPGVLGTTGWDASRVTEPLELFGDPFTYTNGVARFTTQRLAGGTRTCLPTGTASFGVSFVGGVAGGSFPQPVVSWSRGAFAIQFASASSIDILIDGTIARTVTLGADATLGAPVAVSVGVTETDVSVIVNAGSASTETHSKQLDTTAAAFVIGGREGHLERLDGMLYQLMLFDGSPTIEQQHATLAYDGATPDYSPFVSGAADVLAVNLGGVGFGNAGVVFADDSTPGDTAGVRREPGDAQGRVSQDCSTLAPLLAAHGLVAGGAGDTSVFEETADTPLRFQPPLVQGATDGHLLVLTWAECGAAELRLVLRVNGYPVGGVTVAPGEVRRVAVHLPASALPVADVSIEAVDAESDPPPRLTLLQVFALSAGKDDAVRLGIAAPANGGMGVTSQTNVHSMVLTNPHVATMDRIIPLARSRSYPARYDAVGALVNVEQGVGELLWAPLAPDELFPEATYRMLAVELGVDAGLSSEVVIGNLDDGTCATLPPPAWFGHLQTFAPPSVLLSWDGTQVTVDVGAQFVKDSRVYVIDFVPWDSLVRDVTVPSTCENRAGWATGGAMSVADVFNAPKQPDATLGTDVNYLAYFTGDTSDPELPWTLTWDNGDDCSLITYHGEFTLPELFACSDPVDDTPAVTRSVSLDGTTITVRGTLYVSVLKPYDAGAPALGDFEVVVPTAQRFALHLQRSVQALGSVESVELWAEITSVLWTDAFEVEFHMHCAAACPATFASIDEANSASWVATGTVTATGVETFRYSRAYSDDLMDTSELRGVIALLFTDSGGATVPVRLQVDVSLMYADLGTAYAIEPHVCVNTATCTSPNGLARAGDTVTVWADVVENGATVGLEARVVDAWLCSTTDGAAPPTATGCATPSARVPAEDVVQLVNEYAPVVDARGDLSVVVENTYASLADVGVTFDATPLTRELSRTYYVQLDVEYEDSGPDPERDARAVRAGDTRSLTAALRVAGTRDEGTGEHGDDGGSRGEGAMAPAAVAVLSVGAVLSVATALWVYRTRRRVARAARGAPLEEDEQP